MFLLGENALKINVGVIGNNPTIGACMHFFGCRKMRRLEPKSIEETEHCLVKC